MMPSRLENKIQFITAMVFFLLMMCVPFYSGASSYSYDNGNRLIRVDFADGSKIEYTYDESGSRTRKLTTSPNATPALLYAANAGAGISKWDGTAWAQVTPNNPNMMVAAAANLYAAFAGNGIWKNDGTTWTQVTPNNPNMIVAAAANLYAANAEAGISKWDGTIWTQVTPNNPNMMVATAANLYGAFAGNGIWKWEAGAWTQITPTDPAAMVSGF